MPSTKETMLDIIARQPDDSSYVEILRELEYACMVHRGLDDSDTGHTLPDESLQCYSRVLEFAILDLRMRIRYEEEVSIPEVHDLLDAIHNIPKMLRSRQGWHVPENIDADLARYDAKWRSNDDSTISIPLLRFLNDARAGKYDSL